MSFARTAGTTRNVWSGFTVTRVVALGCLLSFGLTACSHVTLITTNPEGASIRVNNTYLGKSPVRYYSRSGTPETHFVEIELDGYEPQAGAAIEKSYRADESLLLLLPGIIPYFFSARFEDR